MTPAFPVLWLCGPPGVGKTTVAWEMYSQLTRAGVDCGFVDIDQLGMCYPEPAEDPGRHRMKARNLHAVVAGFREAGAQGLIVSGVVDPARGVLADRIPRAGVTVCRMRADRDVLRERFLGRGAPADLVDDVLREADALDASDFADLCVGTSGMDVAQVVRLVTERTDGWLATAPVRSSDAPEPQPAPPADGTVLWLCGATGVGKSTVGFAVYQRVLRAGVAAAYLDLDQLGFCHPVPEDDPGNHRVKARNLAAVRRTYRAAGAQVLILTGPVEDETAVKAYADALPGADLRLYRLHAEREHLTERIMSRREGGSWAQPGDPLRGKSVAHLRHVADEAVSSAAALEAAGIGDLRIDTDARTVQETADTIAAHAGLPPGVRPS
ncbi:AAA family ATPase [Streptomyces sp. A7024]|uniref:AAA family ATPase n=1 Tax=Streptomyces coryli TaxID=1128680 RepID=A0A6G4U0D9_9ACTN|nr:AAA family ATPase [Streptomyces coryli]NGN65614.1 AAA family ATPase [Streptomyces coryli]